MMDADEVVGALKLVASKNQRIAELEAELAEEKRQHRVCTDERYQAEAEVERLSLLSQKPRENDCPHGIENSGRGGQFFCFLCHPELDEPPARKERDDG